MFLQCLPGVVCKGLIRFQSFQKMRPFNADTFHMTSHDNDPSLSSFPEVPAQGFPGLSI